LSVIFEGDLVRPLGFVTLYFAYAEAEIDVLIDALPSTETYNDNMRKQNVGWKLSYAQKLIRALNSKSLDDLILTLKEAKVLFERRNTIVHSSIFSGGRMVSNRKDVPTQKITPDDLTQLADSIFTCKEYINSYRQRRLMPLLADRNELELK
jgi:hypothetical protein